LFLEDFYPLLDWDATSSAWVAFQFHSPSRQEGMVQAFRGAADTESMIRLKLKALQRDRRYVITNWDPSLPPQVVSGAQLLDEGLMVSCAAKDGCAVVITYRPE
jgi:hypothetical protein